VKNLFQFKGILIFGGVLSMILSPLAITTNQQTYAAENNCTNWAGLHDNDCDGLADEWERDRDPGPAIVKYYEKIVGGSTIRVNLPASISENHRDILVEIDSMTHHIPTTTAIDLAKTKFNTFELNNPDTSTGVKIWYIRDDNIPHQTCIDVFSDTNGNPNDDFDTIKKKYMGTFDERGGGSLTSNFYQAKRDVYRYVLFAHTICGAALTSGRGETDGNDFAVTLGASGWGNVKDGHDTGSEEYKGATFMHELGHNLGLKHGGDEDTNCKPNYISAMSYLFQFPTYVPSRELDYSHSQITSLDEFHLNENSGIGPSDPVGLPTAVGHATTSSHSSSIPHKLPASADNSNINYNWYTGNTNPNQNDVQSSIINFHFTGCGLNNLRTLYGFDDVHYNILNFWGTETGFLNATGGPGPVATSDVGSPIVPIVLTSGLNNSNISKSNQSTIQNTSEADILKDPTLPPCDLSVPGCQDFPCDIENDPNCKRRIDLRHNFTNTTLLSVDYGNRANLSAELTLTDVLNAISSKVLDINGFIQSLNDSSFKQGTNVSKLKQDIQNSLVDAPDSVHSQIKSGKADDPLAKTLKLRGLVQSKILDPEKNEVLKLVDELKSALQQKPDKSTD
jgi:Metallo-peptidase family M12B Reprolysin-like